MNIAMDSKGLHLFTFQENTINSDLPNLANVSRHHVIKFDEIKEFIKEGDTDDNFVIVSFNRPHTFVYLIMYRKFYTNKKYNNAMYLQFLQF